MEDKKIVVKPTKTVKVNEVTPTTTVPISHMNYGKGMFVTGGLGIFFYTLAINFTAVAENFLFSKILESAPLQASIALLLIGLFSITGKK
jgi:hypothetical protein